MRENTGLYRGKRKDNGEWVKGYYACIAGNNMILTGKIDITNRVIGAEAFELIPNTIGEFSGITDKNENKIFEGDIVKIIESGYGNDVHYGKVVFLDGCFVIEYNPYIMIRKRFIEKQTFQDGNANITVTYKYEVVGNICDNPELLKEI